MVKCESKVVALHAMKANDQLRTTLSHPNPSILQPRGCGPGTLWTGKPCDLEPVWSFLFYRESKQDSSILHIVFHRLNYRTGPFNVVYLRFPVEQLYSKETNEFSEINIVWTQHTCNEALKRILFTERGDGVLKIVKGWRRGDGDCSFSSRPTSRS